MSEQPFIVCENLVKIYKVADLEVVALQGIDLTIQGGEMLALVGPSGSGKSTLMNILGGLDAPTAGRVSVGEYNLLEMTRREQVLYRRRQVGFVWQQTARNLLPYLSAQENVELPMALDGVPARQRRQRAQMLLEQVGLGGRLKHRPDRLSGGEQQRVAIARALIHEPFLILADEPTGNLDEETGASVLSLLLELTRDAGKTLIMATHNPEVVPFADVVYHIHEGKLVAEPKA